MFPIDFIRRGAERHPDRIAAAEGERRWRFADLVANADAAAASFQALAGKTRVVVGVCSPNTLEHFAAIMAVHAAGGVLVPLNYRNTAAEMADLVEVGKPDVVFADAGVADRLAAFGGRLVVARGPAPAGGHAFEDLLQAHRGQAPLWPDVAAEDASAIKFTGGSSGKPKGVVQSFRCVATLIANMLVTFGFARDEVHLCVAPISHGAGTFMVPVLAAGGANLLLKEPQAAAILNLLETGGVTAMFAPPTLIYSIIEAAGGRQPRFPALRHLVYGAAPMPPERVREARAFFGGRLECVYGQTEMPSLMTALTAEEMADDSALASVGRPSPFVRLAIMKPDGGFAAAGELGEIVARSDMMMSGYLGMPDKTAETIVDGWLHTGDVGCLDARGLLFIKDRLRDVVITGGFNVYPSDVEAALVRHAAVYDCVVFGVPDEKWGERVEAVVQLHPGADATPADLIAHAKALIGSVKAPKVVHVVADLPRSAVGKVLRREAKALVAGRPSTLAAAS